MYNILFNFLVVYAFLLKNFPLTYLHRLITSVLKNVKNVTKIKRNALWSFHTLFDTIFSDMLPTYQQ